ncbi:MAG TPA: hypothetical protein VFA64_04710 [Hyphomicrobiaceae bacterium]|nr:hypothetical protein [Hyphomicrobiaceae bacterium]
MRIRKTLLTALAVAIALAFSPLPELQAATLLSPGSQPGTDNLAQTVKAKKKTKKAGKKKKGKKKKGKKAGSKAGKCGTYMYFSKKSRKCMDARKK